MIEKIIVVAPTTAVPISTGLAVELAVQLTASQGAALTHILAAAFFAVSFFFVYRSFYGMRIRSAQ